MEISDELKDLYTIYQQEIHASIYTSVPRTQSRMVYDTKLPPIYKRTYVWRCHAKIQNKISSFSRLTSADSSSSSDWSPISSSLLQEESDLRPLTQYNNSFDILMGPEVKNMRTRLPSIHSRTRHIYPSASTSSDD